MDNFESGKQCCVTDTGALVNLSRIKIARRRAIEWVLEDFCLLIPQKIFDEGKRNFTRRDNKGRIFYFTTIQQRIYAMGEVCEIVIEQQVEGLEADLKSKIDSGEQKAAAFAFELSRKRNQYVLFVTNDFKAIPSLNQIFTTTQSAFVKNAYELLVFLASRHPSEISLGEIEIAIRELNRMERDSTKDDDVPMTPDEYMADCLRAIQNFPDAFSKI